MIISVHLPKTAGSSFRISLESHFAERILLDYSDLPIHQSPLIRNGNSFQIALDNTNQPFEATDCIHGHFMPVKYRFIKAQEPIHYVTWLRHPVDRVISHYYFWKRRYWPEAPALHRRLAEENWSLEKFCLSPEMKNLYHQFMWGFPVEKFGFIGITEHYTEDFSYFVQTYLHHELPELSENRNPVINNYSTVSDSFRREVEDFHRDDMNLYEFALNKRLHRFEEHQQTNVFPQRSLPTLL
jgi:hypothetical protein